MAFHSRLEFLWRWIGTLVVVRRHDCCAVRLAGSHPDWKQEDHTSDVSLCKLNGNYFCHNCRPDAGERDCRDEPAQPRALRAEPGGDVCRNCSDVFATGCPV